MVKKSLLNVILKTITVTCIGILALGLTGCGNANSGDSVESDGASHVSGDSSSKDEKVTFSWWGNDARHQYTMDGIDLFEEKNSNINVEYHFGEWSGYERRNRVWMESASAADVMQINYGWLDTYSPDGKGYYDLNELADYIDLSEYDEEDLKYGMKDGHLNAIPIAFNTQTFCFNSDLLKEYGFEQPKTWDDLFDMAKVVSQDERFVLGMPKKHVFLMLIAYYEQTTGQHMFDEDGNCIMSEDDVALLLDFYKNMVDEKVLMPIEDFDRKKLGTGECVGGVFWVSDADNYCGTLVENGYTPVMVKYPMQEGAKLSGMYMKPATLYAINDSTENPEVAAKLLNFLVSDSEMAVLQGTEKGVPINKEALAALEEENMLDTFGYKAFELMQESKSQMDVMKTVMEDEVLIDNLKDIAAEYLFDKLTKEETVEQIYSLIEEAK